MRPERIEVKLTPKGLAFCDFAFRDGVALGLSESEASDAARRLIEQWDGSRTLKQMYLSEKALDASVVYEDILDAPILE